MSGSTGQVQRLNVIAQDQIVGNTIGVLVDQGASYNTIGGKAPGAGNVVSGNTIGIDITDAGTSGNLVAGNLIGTDAGNTEAMPNTGAGVKIENGASRNKIGIEGAGNVIAFNQGSGGLVLDTSALGNTVRFNQFFGNVGPGIVETSLGGPDPFPNSPVLSVSMSPNAITGTFSGTASKTYTLDFFANPVGDSPARPQGRDYLGSIKVLTDGTGDSVFSFYFTPIVGEPVVTATATDTAGNTSPLSSPVDSALITTPLSLKGIAAIPFQGSVASFTGDVGATASDFTATIIWGDQSTSSGTVVPGPGGFVVSGTHTYAQSATNLPITVTIVDARDLTQFLAHSLIDVAPSPLQAFAQTASFTEGTAASRVVASFTDSLPGSFAGQFTAVIDWGDNQASAGTISADGAGFDVTGTHTYIQAGTGTYSITVMILDAATGATVNASSTAQVALVPLTLQGLNFAVTGNKNFTGVVATLSDGDPRIDPTFYTATITWDDNTTSTGTISGSNPFTISASHTFSSFTSTHLITVTVTDALGRTASVVDRVVDPPAPARQGSRHAHQSRHAVQVRRLALGRFPAYLHRDKLSMGLIAHSPAKDSSG